MESLISYLIIAGATAYNVNSNSNIVKGIIGFTWPLGLYLKMTGGYDSFKIFLDITIARVIG